MECGICGHEEDIPFKCSYCKGIFCSAHRLPPNHNCVFLSRFMKKPEREREFLDYVSGRTGSTGERIVNAVRNATVLRFSKTEILHLVIGTALVVGVGMSLFGFRLRLDYIVIFVSAFIIHELAHKFLAQFYRAWAEFRVQFYGAVITAISALPFFPFKFIAPGAVFISGPISEQRSGKISLIGPLTNIAMSLGFLLSYYLASALYDRAVQILITGAIFNSWIAFFNLIPFMGLDGSKIFSWNKLVWILTFALAIALYVVGDIVGGRGLFGLFR